MPVRLTRFTWLGASVLFFAVLLFIGCSDTPITGPDSDADISVVLSPDQSVDLSKGIPENPGSECSGSSFPGVYVPINYDCHLHSFSIPEGGLTLTTPITLRIMTTYAIIRDKRVLACTFGPSGLVFDRPAVLNIDMTAVNEAAKSAKLLYFDPAVRDWVVYDQESVSNGRVEFEISHFSKYAISE